MNPIPNYHMSKLPLITFFVLFLPFQLGFANTDVSIKFPNCWGGGDQIVFIDNDEYDKVISGSIGKAGFFMFKAKGEQFSHEMFLERIESLKLSTLKEYYHKFGQQIAKDDMRFIEKDTKVDQSDGLSVFYSSILTLNMASPEAAPHEYDIYMWQSGDYFYELEISYIKYLNGPEAGCIEAVRKAALEIIEQTKNND